jgi:hypothetical protein
MRLDATIQTKHSQVYRLELKFPEAVVLPVSTVRSSASNTMRLARLNKGALASRMTAEIRMVLVKLDANGLDS